MNIKSIYFENFRGYQKSPVYQFSERFTIISGINGLGKTTLLDGVATAITRLISGLEYYEGVSNYRKIFKKDFYNDSTNLGIEAKFDCIGIPVAIKVNANKKGENISSDKNDLGIGLVEEVRRKYLEDDLGDRPVVVSYANNRAIYTVPQKVPKTVPKFQELAYRKALSYRSIDYQDFIARFRMTTVLAEEGGDLDSMVNVFTAINDCIHLFIPSFSNFSLIETEPYLKLDKDGLALTIRQLSDGERSFVAMVFDLCRRLYLANPELEDPRLGRGIVVIDELELHLHPRWQVRIVEFLRAQFPNIQFIVTTHSPFIIQTARQGEVINLGQPMKVDPYGKSIEEISKFVMDVENTEYSPRIKNMKEVAKRYLELAEEARTATPERKKEISKELDELLLPFSDNPAYTALLESKGYIDPEK